MPRGYARDAGNAPNGTAGNLLAIGGNGEIRDSEISVVSNFDEVNSSTVADTRATVNAIASFGANNIGVFELVSGEVINATPKTNYKYSDNTKAAVNLNINDVPENQQILFYNETGVTLSVNGESATLLNAGSHIRIFKSAAFDNGFAIVN